MRQILDVINFKAVYLYFFGRNLFKKALKKEWEKESFLIHWSLKWNYKLPF